MSNTVPTTNSQLRVAIVSDIHGNRTAFAAVLEDLRLTSPDLVFHGGDLADSGSSPVEIVDQIRDLRWGGIVGNTDEMLFRPESLVRAASQSPQLQALSPVIAEMADATRERLGEDRLSWLRALPRVLVHDPLALVHATPDNLWRAPGLNASDAELQSIYAGLGRPVAIYGHIHQPYIRTTSGMTVANSGSVGLPYDGDPRASYLLFDGSRPTVRRVEYDVSRELQALLRSGLPHAQWIARMLESGSPQMP